MQTAYSLRDVARMFDLKENRLRYWAQTGFVNPSGRLESKSAYTFSDLVEVRAARDLLQAGIPLQRVRRNLQVLRDTLPKDVRPSLSRLQVRSDGETLIVSSPDASFEPITGQLLINFELSELSDQVAKVLPLTANTSQQLIKTTDATTEVPRSVQKAREQGVDEDRSGAHNAAAEPFAHSAYEWFQIGCSCDTDDKKTHEAIHAYQQALVCDPRLAAAHLNLGNVYYRIGENEAAQACYHAAIECQPDLAEAYYNLGNIYEEQREEQREEQNGLILAIDAYRRALQIDAHYADAHFNLALALERVGSRIQAATHWQRYVDHAGLNEETKQWIAFAKTRLKCATSSS